MESKSRKGRQNMNQSLIQEVRKMSNTIQGIPSITNKIILDLKSKQFPIPIVKILKELKFQVITQELPDYIGGYIAIGEEVKKIFKIDKIVCSNCRDSLGHQRFALAHELAHYIYDYNEEKCEFYDAYNTKNKENDTEERANQFAANLLMPEGEFRFKYSTNCSIEELQEYFGVTQTAVIKRICELKLV